MNSRQGVVPSHDLPGLPVALHQRQEPAANKSDLSWSCISFGLQNSAVFLFFVFCLNYYPAFKNWKFSHKNPDMPSFFLRNWELRQVYLLSTRHEDSRCSKDPDSLQPFTFLISIAICLTPAAIGDTFSDCSNTFLSELYIPNMFGSRFLAIGDNVTDFQNRELFPGIKSGHLKEHFLRMPIVSCHVGAQHSCNFKKDSLSNGLAYLIRNFWL